MVGLEQVTATERYSQDCYAAAIEELGLLLIEKEDIIHKLTVKNQRLEKEIWNMKNTKLRKRL